MATKRQNLQTAALINTYKKSDILQNNIIGYCVEYKIKL